MLVLANKQDVDAVSSDEDDYPAISVADPVVGDGSLNESVADEVTIETTIDKDEAQATVDGVELSTQQVIVDRDDVNRQANISTKNVELPKFSIATGNASTPLTKRMRRPPVWQEDYELELETKRRRK